PSYEANLLGSRIGAPYIELLNGLLPRGFELNAGEGSVQANLHVSGEGPQLRSVVGKLTFSSVTLQTPHLHRAVRELKGELDFEPQRLVFHELAGKLGQATLTVGGELVGDYVTSRTGTLHLSWQSRADARELGELVQSAGTSVGHTSETIIPLGGMILSEGELTQIIEGDPNSWPAPSVSGKLIVQNLGFRHKALPAAVTEMNGELEIDNARVRFVSLHAKLGESQVVVSGELAGDRYFWQDPVLSATLAVAANASAWVQSFEPNLQSLINTYRPSGQLAATIQCLVPLASWQRAEITGSATLSQGGLEIATDDLVAKVANLSAEAAWDGKRFALRSFHGEVNGIRASASATVDGSRIALQLKAQGSLEQVQAMFPRMEPFAEIHGPALCDASVEILEGQAASDSAAQHQLLKLIAGVGPRVLRAYQNARIHVNGQVVAGNSSQGASFRHHAMPPARTLPYGISVPRGEITDIHGVLALKGTTIEVPENAPLRCAMADTPNCRLSGTIAFIPNHYPSLKFRVETTDEARFDTWLTGWGADFHPPARRGAPLKGKRFELGGTIVAPRATYKGEHVGQCSGELSYVYVSGEPPRRTEFRNVTIEGFGGIMRGYGLIESWRDKPEEYPRWQAEVQLDHVRIPPLSRWVFRDPKLVEGSLTGRIELQGMKTDVQRLKGKGRVNLLQVEVGRLPFILKLFQMVNLTQTRGLFEKAAYNSKHEAHFLISDGVMTWDRVELETEGLLLELRGRYFLEDHRIDAQVRLNLFESSLLGAIPVVGDLARMADRTLGKVIVAFRVSGPAAQPSITPIPLPLFQSPPP
ncbi:MAG: AsmA-like C-terminal region-containing protein, partial [Candidatus Sumerlaeaceae bacterium]